MPDNSDYPVTATCEDCCGTGIVKRCDHCTMERDRYQNAGNPHLHAHDCPRVTGALPKAIPDPPGWPPPTVHRLKTLLRALIENPNCNSRDSEATNRRFCACPRHAAMRLVGGGDDA